MAMYNYYDGHRVPQYYRYPSPSELAVPVTFLDPRRPEVYRREDHYLNDNYRRYYRLQDNSDYRRYGLMPLEQVVQREGGAGHVTPWWLGWDYPNNGGYVGTYPLPPLPWDYDHETRQDSMTVEMYVPLCCEECERKVRKHLKGIEGVESVSADQWEKKVVVVGHNLHPQFLLRRMQRDKPASVFWSDRHR